MVKLYQEYFLELQEAFKAEDLKTVDRLFKERPSLRNAKREGSLLHNAILFGYSAKVISYLLDSGIDPNVKHSDANAIWVAAHKGRNDIIELLLERGAVFDLSASHRNPLIVSRCIETSKLLLDSGIDVHKTYKKMDALSFAASVKDQEKVDLILSYQANGNPKAEARLRKRANKIMKYKPGPITRMKMYLFERIDIWLGRH